MKWSEVALGFIVLIIAATAAVLWFGTPGLWGVLIGFTAVAVVVAFYLWRSRHRT